MVGNVLPELGGAKAGRMAMFHAGFPESTCFTTVNRQCSSGLQAINNVAMMIQTNQISVGIAAGVESMTRNYGSRAIPVDLSPEMKASPVKDVLDCIMVGNYHHHHYMLALLPKNELEIKRQLTKVCTSPWESPPRT